MFSSKENFAQKLYRILKKRRDNADITIGEWRLLGQEQNGGQIVSWYEKERDEYKIGVYTHKKNSLELLYSFKGRQNVIQASVNSSFTALVYVLKESIESENDKKENYIPYFVILKSKKEEEPVKLQEPTNKQVMVQFVYGRNTKYDLNMKSDRFILFTHLDCIKLFPVTLIDQSEDDEGWVLNDTLPKPDTIVKSFLWAQWDCLNQVLYYIHNRSLNQSFAEGEEPKSPSDTTPTLSALQFHGDQPHETVLKIPLSLPQMPTPTGPACGLYEDNPVPLRVHDCSLDLQIVSDASGIVCICHHYLYKNLEESESSLTLDDSMEFKKSGVNLAYSVTLLHHGKVVHCVLPGLQWAEAKSLRPSFTLYNDNHLLVNLPSMYIHMLDVGLDHEPSCHFILKQPNTNANPKYTPLIGWGDNVVVERYTLDVLTLNIKDSDVGDMFKFDGSMENKLGIMHYLVQHAGSFGVADELISWSISNPDESYGSFLRLMHEYLLATSYVTTKRSLPPNSSQITRLLPYTLNTKLTDIKIDDICVSVSQEKLWNSSVVLLSPRQRVSPVIQDMWTRLWQYLQFSGARFNQQTVVDKLKLSLECYQPEIVSRCSTPLSPSGSSAPPPRRYTNLPFHEIELCTASKQEHVMAANVREMNMHVMRCSASTANTCSITRWDGDTTRWGTEVGTRHASAQLLATRELCAAICNSLSLPHFKGLQLVEELDMSHRYILFKLLEQYYMAVESIAFPLPQGFASFFSYLGYKALEFPDYMQYLHRGVFELQIDVLKAIVADNKDGASASLARKLRVLQMAGEARAKRALANCPHTTALRARRHAHTLLCGLHDPPRRVSGHGPVQFGETIKPLDTFLDLLTAKASLNELDFNLIIEATLKSIES